MAGARDKSFFRGGARRRTAIVTPITVERAGPVSTAAGETLTPSTTGYVTGPTPCKASSALGCAARGGYRPVPRAGRIAPPNRRPAGGLTPTLGIDTSLTLDPVEKLSR